jgi:hypothetical protein
VVSQLGVTSITVDWWDAIVGGTSTHSLVVIGVDETREEAALALELERTAGPLVVAGDDTVVALLEVEFDDVTLGGLDLLRVEGVVLLGRDLDGLAVGQGGKGDGGEEALDGRHCRDVVFAVGLIDGWDEFCGFVWTGNGGGWEESVGNEAATPINIRVTQVVFALCCWLGRNTRTSRRLGTGPSSPRKITRPLHSFHREAQ